MSLLQKIILNHYWWEEFSGHTVKLLSSK